MSKEKEIENFKKNMLKDRTTFEPDYDAKYSIAKGNKVLLQTYISNYAKAYKGALGLLPPKTRVIVEKEITDEVLKDLSTRRFKKIIRDFKKNFRLETENHMLKSQQSRWVEDEKKLNNILLILRYKDTSFREKIYDIEEVLEDE